MPKSARQARPVSLTHDEDARPIDAELGCGLREDVAYPGHGAIRPRVEARSLMRAQRCAGGGDDHEPIFVSEAVERGAHEVLGLLSKVVEQKDERVLICGGVPRGDVGRPR